MKVEEKHEFIDLGIRIIGGRPIAYVRCTKCGLLIRKRNKLKH